MTRKEHNLFDHCSPENSWSCQPIATKNHWSIFNTWVPSVTM